MVGLGVWGDTHADTKPTSMQVVAMNLVAPILWSLKSEDFAFADS